MASAALLLLMAAQACRDDSHAQAPDKSAPAAKVVDLVGDVVAESPAGPRVLAVADEVAGADTLVTAAGSSVTVRFYHNNAQWTLGAGKRRRVSESAAWSAPRSQGEPALFGAMGEDLTAAAGRHGEREAASTRTTALAPAEEPGGAHGADREAPEAPAGVAIATPVEREAGGIHPARRKNMPATSSRSNSKKKSMDRSRSGTAMDTLVGSEQPMQPRPPQPRSEPAALSVAPQGGAAPDSKTAATRSQGGGTGSTAPTIATRLIRITVTGPLDEAAVTSVIRGRLATLNACRPAPSPATSAATAHATTLLEVSTSGAVTIARSTSRTDQPWASCLAKALAAIRAGELGKPAAPVQITLELEQRAVP